MSMRGFEFGFKQGIFAVCEGMVISAIGIALKGSLGSSPLILIAMLNAIGTAGSLFSMFNWGLAHMAGWLFGIGIIWSSGLLGAWDVFLLFFVPIIIFILVIYIREHSAR